jgi:hypothetical protein
MTEIKFYKSKWKAIRLILLSLPLVAASIFLLHKSDANNTLSWFCICFFGLGIPFGLFNLLDNRPELVLDENGIFDRMSYGIFSKKPARDPVRWDWITDVYLKVMTSGMLAPNQKYICFRLNEEGLSHREAKKNKLSNTFGLADYNIPLMNLNIDENKLIEFIKTMVSADKATKSRLLQSTVINNFK